ncbi:exo-alpha-sialidase [Cryobacterium sp. TMT1-2-2]|uniref:F510_1955 family glycosylhydrolase n=1 Tax=Cryobacterium sp. TMT1-2-2 TaxID=1259233 RepID=UPI00106B0C5E|nr:sialidase family protein [Cryobacterium sp. TMT1-2-2]TFD13019.1 exo-alpha-sialidase [Cryobacterium sp. TMT1-2-2]
MPRSPRRFFALTLLLVGLVAITGCSASASNSAAGSLVTAPVPNAFEHVHGLGADPLTGETYAATHHGVWLVPTGVLADSYLAGAPRPDTTQPIQIAGLAQDTMGFTVAGPGQLLASGHPDPTKPSDLALPNLGLISSTDGAKSWTALSLAGETDFHDLDAVALEDGTLRVYGYDAGAGAIAVSDDSGLTWSSGAVLALRDLAADPSQADRLYATTADGLMMSTDAGRTFALMVGAPALLLVDVVETDTDTQLVGIDPNGAVWRQTADTWTQTGTTSRTPEAFTVVGGPSPWLLVADAAGIAASDDGGVTWTSLISLAD